MKLFLSLALLHTLVHADFSGTVFDKKTFKPIQNAIISDSKNTTKSDINGKYTLKSQEKTAHIKAYGYKAAKITTTNKATTTKLQPFTVKALYLTFWGASGNSKTMDRMLKIIDNTEVNSIIVDIKNEYGSTLYKTSFEEANSYGAHKKRTNRDIAKFMKELKSRNIYTIARIVTFKDELQAYHNPDYAIKDADGEIWRNHDNMAWVDPYDARSHKYTIRIAEEAAQIGFDEINFDYIRFPAKVGLQFSKPHNQENRIEAIGTFLQSAQKALQKYGVYISVDIFGNVIWTQNCDNNIGQTVTTLAKHADYLAPMLYPSGFSRGSFGKKNPAEHPFIVISRSLKKIQKQIDISRVRPWLQYFRDYAHTKRHYKKHEIREQIRASEEIESNGWMMWSPSSKYHQEYFKTL